MLPTPRARFCLLLVLIPSVAWGYGYSRDEDPFLLAFREAVRAARAQDLDAAREQVEQIGWQLDELATAEDLGVDFREAFGAAHGAGAQAARVVEAWTNLLYLALLQKLHWNLSERLSDYHKARARLEAAQAYYEIGLAGNVRLQDERRRARDPQAPSRHDDLVHQFELAREALGSPGLFGAGARDPNPETFRAASVRIAGHLRAVFPGFTHPR